MKEIAYEKVRKNFEIILRRPKKNLVVFLEKFLKNLLGNLTNVLNTFWEIVEGIYITTPLIKIGCNLQMDCAEILRNEKVVIPNKYDTWEAGNI